MNSFMRPNQAFQFPVERMYSASSRIFLHICISDFSFLDINHLQIADESISVPAEGVVH